MFFSSSDIYLIGTYNNKEISQSIKLNQPKIITCREIEKDIKTIEGNILRHPCLVTREYSIFEYEICRFKESPYGNLHRGFILNKDSNGIYKRTTDKHQIIVKKYNKEHVDLKLYVDNPIQEFSVLQYIGDNHPNVSGQIACLTDGCWYYSVMKFRGYDLGSYLFQSPRIDEKKCQFYFRQIIHGMKHLQSLNICHRDLSLENFVYDEETQQVSIIDFGMSLVLPKDPSTGQPYLIPPAGAVGKVSYMPPEIFSNQEPFNGFLSDHWSLGILLFLMLTKKNLVTSSTILCDKYKHILRGGLRNLLMNAKLGLSEEVIDLLCRLIQINPSNRPTLQEIEEHPWIKEDNNYIDKHDINNNVNNNNVNNNVTSTHLSTIIPTTIATTLSTSTTLLTNIDQTQSQSQLPLSSSNSTILSRTESPTSVKINPHQLQNHHHNHYHSNQHNIKNDTTKSIISSENNNSIENR